MDGLRAHAFGRFRGDQLLLGQAECTVALPAAWRGRAAPTAAPHRPHAIVFVDAGDAWTATRARVGPRRSSPIKVDGGLGLTTAEDNMRIYVARNLQRARASAVVSVRLQRPF